MMKGISSRRCDTGRPRSRRGARGPGPLFAFSLALILAAYALVTSSAWAGEEKHFEVRIAARAVAEGGPVLRAKQGDQVVITWHSDEAGELHLHGYDIAIELTAEAPSRTSFEAFAAGRYPITSHGFAGASGGHGHEALLYLEVYPD